MDETLLAGEPDTSDDLETVEHWLHVYEELASFANRALAEAGPSTNGQFDGLRARASVFSNRLALWRERERALAQEQLNRA